MGHALHTLTLDRSSLEACIRSSVTSPGSEGDAVYNSIVVREEILKNGHGIDIAKNSHEDIHQMDEYETYVREGNKQNALNNIGESYLKNHPSVAPNLTYREYYGNYCKQFFKSNKKR